MTNYTLRLPADLRTLAEEEAKAHCRDLAEELRLALASYYKRPWGLATNQDLEDAILNHERRYHVLCVDVGSESFTAIGRFDPETVSLRKVPPAPAPDLVERPSDPIDAESPPSDRLLRGRFDSDIIHGASGFDFPRTEALRYLRGLHDMLGDNLSPTPTDLEAFFGQPSRRIGRVLNQFDIKAKNTRVNSISSRFYLPSMIGEVRKAIEELGGKEDE